MTRILTVLIMLCCIIAIPTGCMADSEIPRINENFSIRNGISFGMSIDEVKNIEAATREPEIEEGEKAGDFSDVTIVKYQVSSLVGVNIPSWPHKPWLYYYFNSDEKLFEITYWWGYSQNLEEIKETFYELRDIITEKYGKPLHAQDGAFFPLCTTRLLDASPRHLLTNINLNQWLVEYNDCYVVIDCYYATQGGNYLLQMSQRTLTKDSVKEVLESFADQEIERAQQRQNDI